MPGGKRALWILAAVVGVAGCSAFILAPSFGKLPPPQTLPDGTIVRIVKAGYGRVYRYVPTNGWRKIAGQILPEKYSAKLGIEVHSYTNATDTTYFTLETVNANPMYGYQPFPAATNLHSMYSVISQDIIGASVELDDDAGNGFLLQRLPGWSFGIPNPQIYQLPLVSHAARTFTLKVRDYDNFLHTNYFSTFVVRNPAPRSAPRWQARPLPLTNGVDDLTVELLEIRPGTPHDFRIIMLQGHVSHGTVARLRIRQDGAPSSAWRATGVTVTDEEGNVFMSHAIDYPAEDTIGFDGGFSPREIRKFHFEINRAPPFAPGESATATNVSLPRFWSSPPGPIVSLDAGGYHLQLHELKLGMETVNFTYHFSPQPPAGLGVHLLFYATDPNGRRILLKYFDGGDGATITGGFDLPTAFNLTNLDITFLVSKTRQIDFIARPLPAGANAGAVK